ncbi:MAG: hypothetical protein VX465_00910, partial [Pseudomonadota bacterium]|nr:hypothetical protein [Pseudomonadota bacterium]
MRGDVPGEVAMMQIAEIGLAAAVEHEDDRLVVIPAVAGPRTAAKIGPHRLTQPAIAHRQRAAAHLRKEIAALFAHATDPANPQSRRSAAAPPRALIS